MWQDKIAQTKTDVYINNLETGILKSWVTDSNLYKCTGWLICPDNLANKSAIKQGPVRPQTY